MMTTFLDHLLHSFDGEDLGLLSARQEYELQEYVLERFDETSGENGFKDVMGDRRMERGVKRYLMVHKRFEHSEGEVCPRHWWPGLSGYLARLGSATAGR